ncbi:MAG TPA: hypothetical protein VGK56_07555 [Anaerolineales bacterium]
MAFKISFHSMMFFVITVFAAACTPDTAPALTLEPVTPTPEIFNPLDPAPTPSDSTLPPTCQVTDLNVYINEGWGYCFAYPKAFTADESRTAEGIITLYGPGLEDTANPVRASLEITAQVAPPESGLTPLVDAYLASLGSTPLPIQRETGMLGGKPAETLDPVPGLLSSRVTMVLNESILLTLRFHPSDLDLAKPDLEALTQTVAGSFAFLPQTALSASRLRSISWFEFGKNISLSYDSALAPWVEARAVPEVPLSDQVIFAAARPAYVQIRFWGFHGGRPYDLPLMQDDRVAQVIVMQTADFPGFGDDSPAGFVNQLQALKDMLGRGVEPERCAQPITGEPAMPFLPWINAKQSFCAEPQMLEFAHGRGVRYLSHYGQAPSPVMDQQIFYTFQGITDDEQFYVAAFFPVETGIFPTEPPACPKCGEAGYDPFAEWAAILDEQLTQLNAQPENQFMPSLRVLDDVIRSIQIGP